MRYVILKKINNTWYATRNRYTAKELEVIINKLYDDVVDFESITDGDCQGLNDGVIIVKDDGRELDKNGVYLNDDLQPEKKNSKLWILVVLFAMWLFLGVYGVAIFFGVFGFVYLVKYFSDNNGKDVQGELPEDHKAKGMM